MGSIYDDIRLHARSRTSTLITPSPRDLPSHCPTVSSSPFLSLALPLPSPSFLYNPPLFSSHAHNHLTLLLAQHLFNISPTFVVLLRLHTAIMAFAFLRFKLKQMSKKVKKTDSNNVMLRESNYMILSVVCLYVYCTVIFIFRSVI